MPRAALTAAALALLLVGGTQRPTHGQGISIDPHMDPSLVTGGCAACHLGHGQSGSPMLGTPQSGVCLSCHGSAADKNRAVQARVLAPAARPALLSSVLSQPYTHPINRHAYSRYDPGVVVCTSCHSPHRSSRAQPTGGRPSGRRRLSPRDPDRFEYELCQECHGNRGTATQSLADVSRQLSPSNRSYHPVEAPAREASPSILPSLAGAEINCTDCHGNADPTGSRGPHGSPEPYLLRDRYSVVDGSGDSASAHALCYRCHRRERVLDSSVFPEHGSHVNVLGASCATCHAGHGSVRNRALIRFGEETILAGVAPSSSTGRLSFDSPAAGSGSCYLTCHGVDHAPESYGLGAPALVTAGPGGRD